MGLTAIDTPDATTIVFHLKAPFADFDYLVAIPQSAPVPPAKDTGANYQTHIVSTGPYKFQSYQLNKTAVLVPNPNWNAATDPTVSQLPSKIVVNMNMNPNDVDNRLLAGDVQVDLAGTGVQAAARAKILSNPKLKAHADDPVTGFGWFFYIDTQVAPFNNVACRQADRVRGQQPHAADRLRRPGGRRRHRQHGPAADRGRLPEVRPVRGHHQDPGRPGQGQARCCRPAASRTASPPGSPTAATGPPRPRGPRRCSRRCRRSASSSRCTATRPRTYFSNFAGVPKYVSSHDIGLAMGGWGADWPDGYGFLQPAGRRAVHRPGG